MFDWQPDVLKDFELTWTTGLLAVAATVFVSAVAAALAAWLLVRLPARAFADPDWNTGSTAWDWAVWAARLVVGLVLVALGLLLSMPGIPGPGLALVALGLLIADFRGKRWLVRKLLAHEATVRPINRLRARFGKPPLVVPD